MLVQSSLKDLNLNPRSAHNLNSTRNMSPVGYVLAFLIFFFFFLSTSLSLVRNVGCHTWVRHSSCKSSAAHFCQCVQEQCCPFLSVCAIFLCIQTMVRLQFWGFLMCTQTLIHAIVLGSCTDTVREVALEVNSGENLLPLWGLKPASALRLAF